MPMDDFNLMKAVIKKGIEFKKPVLTPEEVNEQQLIAQEIIEEILEQEKE